SLRRPAQRVGDEMERVWRGSGRRRGAMNRTALSESVRRGWSEQNLTRELEQALSSSASRVDQKSGTELEQAGAQAGDVYGDQLEQSLEETSVSLSSRLGSLAKTAGLAAGAMAGVGIAAVGQQAFQAATGLQRVEAALSGMYGSAEKTEYMMEQLQEQFSASAVGSADVFARVAQSLAGVGSSGDEAVGIMKE